MNREIKFRAWDKIEKQMLIPCYQNYWLLLSIDGTPHQYSLGKLFNAETNYDLMQYTGLKDKNGKEIYEGDVVRLVEQSPFWADDDNTIVEWIGTIEFSSGSFWLHANGRSENCWFQHNEDDLEVIGNIYENPELLKTE